MKQYIKVNISLWERIIFLFTSLIPKDKCYINTSRTYQPLTEGVMRGGNGAIKQVTSNKQPKFKPPSPKPFFDDSSGVKSNL